MCNGQAIPRDVSAETLIEFTHRLSSGLALGLVLGLVVWVWRVYPAQHHVRRDAVLAGLFIITEALLGAGLVLFELVAENASMGRALAMALHLVNTFLLLGAITLTAWEASGGQPVRLKNQGKFNWILGTGFIGMLILGASGAVTALGDTLFPAGSLAEGLQQDWSATAHILIRLRLWHPVIAIITGLYLILAAMFCHLQRPRSLTRRLSRGLTALFLIQLGAGAINVALLAPLWMQLVHLFLADVVWIIWVLLAASVLVGEEEAAPTIGV